MKQYTIILTSEELQKMTNAELETVINKTAQELDELQKLGDAADFGGDAKEFARLERLMCAVEDTNTLALREYYRRNTTEDTAEDTTTEDNTTTTEEENAPQREELPTVENSPTSDKIRKACHEVATRTTTAAKKAGGLLALGLVLCSALFLLGLAAVLMGGTFDALELTGAPRVLLACVLLFTVIIDLIAWAEINALICLNRLHIFDHVGGFNRDLCQYLRPFSVIGLFVRTLREA